MDQLAWATKHYYAEQMWLQKAPSSSRTNTHRHHENVLRRKCTHRKAEFIGLFAQMLLVKCRDGKLTVSIYKSFCHSSFSVCWCQIKLYADDIMLYLSTK